MNYLVRRLLLLVPVVFGVTVIVFGVSHALPVDPVVAVIGEQAAEHPQIVAAYRARWSLNKPLPEQYVAFIGNALHGDLGVSLSSHRPVVQDLRDYFPATAELSVCSILITIVVAIPLGIVAAVFRGRPVDIVIRAGTLTGASVPVFWAALAALSIFYVHLGLAPGPGRLDTMDVPPPAVTGLYTVDSLLSGRLSTFFDALHHLMLPAIVLSGVTVGLLTRIMRTSMLAVLNQDYLRTARSKGAPRRRVVFRHALPNAAIPVITVVGLVFGELLSGAVLTETIFGWPGIGRYAYEAATVADFPAILGVAMLVAFAYLAVNFVVDLAYFAIDPRTREAVG